MCLAFKVFVSVVIISLSRKTRDGAGSALGTGRPHPRAAPRAAGGTRGPGVPPASGAPRAPRSLSPPLHVVRINSLLSSSVTP